MRTVWTETREDNGAGGYTLLELLVVIVIIGILAVQVITGFNSPVSKLKSAAFNLRSDFNYARSEAVNRNTNVGIQFVFGTDLDGDGDSDDGYIIWVDSNGDGAYDIGTESVLKTVAFNDAVRYYNLNATKGPMVDATDAHSAMDMADGSDDDDGVSFTSDRYVWQPDGTPNKGGTVYIYVPSPNNAATMLADPFAVVVSPTTGRIQMVRWHSSSNSWASK